MATTGNDNGPVDAYVLRNSQGRYYLVIECDSDYWVGRIIRKLQTLRERDLKDKFKVLEESLSDYD